MFAFSGSADTISGSLRDWYANLDFAFVDSVPIDEFMLGLGAGLFLLAAANRVVRLILDATETPVGTGESALRGGRVLGPMERLIVAALVLAGDPAGAAIVIAAKSLIRLPEIRSNTQEPEEQPEAEPEGSAKAQSDQVTEYFLVGTFGSLLLAAAVAELVLVTG